MQTWVVEVVFAGGCADSSHITDMFHHGSQSNWHDGDNSTEAEFWQAQRCHSKNLRGRNCFKVYLAHKDGNDIGNYNTNQNWNNFDHALAPDIADDDDSQRDKGKQPVFTCVCDSGRSQNQTDRDNDWAGYNWREEAHDTADAKDRNQSGHHHINKSGNQDTAAGIWEHLCIGSTVSKTRSYCGISTQKSERRAQKCRNLSFGDQMEQKGTQTSHQQSGRDIKTSQNWN